MPRLAAAGPLAALFMLTACGSDAEHHGGQKSQQKFPTVQKAVLGADGSGAFTLSVTISSPYDTPDRYADGWRVLVADSEQVLGKMTLDHDHASEQPFTREQTGLKIHSDVTSITVEGHDQANGYGGKTVTIDVPGS